MKVYYKLYWHHTYDCSFNYTPTYFSLIELEEQIIYIITNKDEYGISKIEIIRE